MIVPPFGDLPTTPVVSIEQAADVLGIGRSLAYRLGREYIDSGGVSGMPAFRLAGCLRVPTWALLELALKGRLVRLCDVDLAALFASVDPDMAAFFPESGTTGQPNEPAKSSRPTECATRRPTPAPFQQLAIDLDT